MRRTEGQTLMRDIDGRLASIARHLETIAAGANGFVEHYRAQLMARIEAGELVGPRIVPCGFIEGQSPFSARNGKVVDSLQAAQDAVDWYAQRGYRQIKIYNSFHPDWARPIAAHAHERGLRVSGHVPAFMKAQQVIEAGYDEIQHINQVLLNFLVDDKTDTRTLERFYLPAEKVGDLDFDSKPVQDFIKLLVDHKTVIDPTLSAFDFIRQRDGEVSQEFAAVADHVPPDVRRGFYSAYVKIPDDATAARYNKSYAKMIEFTGRMYRAGIPLARSRAISSVLGRPRRIGTASAAVCTSSGPSIRNSTVPFEGSERGATTSVGSRGAVGRVQGS
jgi:hypothetical protein